MPPPNPTPTGQAIGGAMTTPMLPPPNLAGLIRAQMQKEQDAQAVAFSRAVAPLEKKILRWVEVPVDSTAAPASFAFFGEKKIGGLSFDTIREPVYEDETDETAASRARANFYKNIEDRQIYQSLALASDLTLNLPHLVPGVSSFMQEFRTDNPTLARDADLTALAATLYFSTPRLVGAKIASHIPVNYAFGKLAQGGTYLARAGTARMLATKGGAAFVQGASKILDTGKAMVQPVRAALPGEITPPTPIIEWLGSKFGKQIYQRVRPAIIAQVEQVFRKSGAFIQQNGELELPNRVSDAAYVELKNALSLLKQELGSTLPIALKKVPINATVRELATLGRQIMAGQTLFQTAPGVVGSAAGGAGLAAGYSIPLLLSPDLNMQEKKDIGVALPMDMLRGALFAGGLHTLGVMGQEFARTSAKPLSNRVLGSKGDILEPPSRALPGPLGPRTPAPALARITVDPLRPAVPITPETSMVQNNLGKNLFDMTSEELVNATTDLGMPQALQPLENLRLSLVESNNALDRVTGEIQETVRALRDPKELSKALRGVAAIRQTPPPPDPSLAQTHGRLLEEWAKGVRDLPGQPTDEIVGVLGFDYAPIFTPGTPPDLAAPTASMARWAAGVIAEASASGVNIADTLLTAPPPIPGGDPQMALAVAAQRIQTLATKVLEANPGAAVGPPEEVLNVPPELRDAPPAQVVPPKPLNLPTPSATTLAHAPDAQAFSFDPQGAAILQAHVSSLLWPEGGEVGEFVATNHAGLLDTDPLVVPVRQDKDGRLIATVPSARALSEASEVDVTEGLRAAALPVAGDYKFHPYPNAGITYALNEEAEGLIIDKPRSENRQWIRDERNEELAAALRGGQVSWKHDPIALAMDVMANPPQTIENGQAALDAADSFTDKLLHTSPTISDAERLVGPNPMPWDANRTFGDMMQEWWQDGAVVEGTRAILLQSMSDMVAADNAMLRAQLQAEVDAKNAMDELLTPRRGAEFREEHGAARQPLASPIGPVKPFKREMLPSPKEEMREEARRFFGRDIKFREMTSDPFTDASELSRLRTSAKVWAMTGQGWTGKEKWFNLLTPQEKFEAMKIRLSKAPANVKHRAQLDALHPRNYPLGYHGGWKPTPEQSKVLEDIYDRSVKEFVAAQDALRKVEAAYAQRASGNKLPDRIPLDKLLSVRLDVFADMIDKKPAQALEFMKHLHYNAYSAETEAEVAALASPERVKRAEELDLFRSTLRNLEGEMVEKMRHPAEDNPKIPWYDNLSHNHRMRMGIAKHSLRFIGTPANVLGPFKQKPSLSLLGKAWESGELENNFWNILHEADFSKNKEAAEIYDRWRRFYNEASKSAALDKAISRRLLFRMSKAELQKLPDDISIPRSGIASKYIPMKFQPEAGRTALSEQMPELYALFDGLIKDAAKSLATTLPGELGQHKANIKHVETERRARVVAAVRAAGVEVAAYDDIPIEARESVEKMLKKEDRGTPGGEGWFNSELVPMSDFPYAHLDELIKAEKKAYQEKRNTLANIRSGKLYRQGYMTQIHTIARPQLEQVLRDPLSPYARYVSAEWRNRFLQNRDPEALLPYATFSTSFPMYLEALLRTKHMEPAFQLAKSKISSLPADTRPYAVEQLRALQHIEMPFDILNNRSIVEGTAHEPTGFDNLVQAVTGHKRTGIVKHMQSIGHADTRPATSFVKGLNAITYPMLLNIDRIAAMSLAEIGYIPLVLGQGRLTEAVKNIGIGVPLQLFNTVRAGLEGIGELVAFAGNKTLGTPRLYSQATKAGQVTDVAYDFETGGRHFGVPSPGAGMTMQAWRTITNAMFGVMKSVEYTIRASQFYTVRSVLKQNNPFLPDHVADRLASAVSKRLIGDYGPLDMSPHLRGQMGRAWGALRKFGLNKWSLATTQASGTYEFMTTLGKGRPPLEPGDQGLGPPQPPPPDVPNFTENLGDEENPVEMDWNALEPDEEARFMQMIIPASHMGAAFPAGKPGSRAATVGSLVGLPAAVALATLLSYIIFYDDETVDPTKLNPLSIGNPGEIAPAFWWRNVERLMNLQAFGKVFGLNAKQVREKKRLEDELRYWIPFMGPMIRAYHRRGAGKFPTMPGPPTFPQQGILPEMIEDTPLESGLEAAGKAVSGVRKKIRKVTEEPLGEALAP